MQVLEVLVTRSPRQGEHISPLNSNRPARMLTYVVKDRKFVGDQIIGELSDFGLCVKWHAGELLKLTVHDDGRSVRKVAREAIKIIEDHKESCYPAEEAVASLV